MLLIADCFPLLEELDLSDPKHLNGNQSNFVDGVETLSLTLLKLRKVNLEVHYYMNDQLFFNFVKNCKLLEEINIYSCWDITNAGIDSAIRERPALTSLSFSNSLTKVPVSFDDSLISLKGLTCLQLMSINISDKLLSTIAMEGLSLTRLVLHNCNRFSYAGIVCLLSKCRRLKHLDLQFNRFLNDQHVIQLSLFLGDLMSINLSHCHKLTKSVLFALARNCPSLSDIKMEDISNGIMSVENSNSLTDFVVSPQIKALDLFSNSWLRDETIIMIVSIFPNLQFLELWNCEHISDEGIFQVLRLCKIRHLILNYCSKVKLLGMNFKVPNLEVLNFSNTMVDDETLYVISKNCCGLLQLLLENCKDVTKKRVKHVLENCTQLREINLEGCSKVHASVVALAVLSRPSLRKIEVPYSFKITDTKKEYFLRLGCLVC